MQGINNLGKAIKEIRILLILPAKSRKLLLFFLIMNTKKIPQTLLFCLVCFVFSTPAHSYIDAYQGLLTDYVKDGSKEGIDATLVDYAAWGQDPRHSQAMKQLQATNTGDLAGDTAMAFWINAYNLLTIDLIIKTGETESIRNQGSIFRNVWKSHAWEINGTSLSLHEIEHEILRSMNDARIHMAINCASLSCPDLLLEPYAVERLDQQLQQQTRKFVENPSKGVQIDAERKKLVISKIFDWFEEDFSDGVVDFISANHNQEVPAEVDGYIEYNWALNSQ